MRSARLLPFFFLLLLIVILGMGLWKRDNVAGGSQLVGRAPDSFSLPYLKTDKAMFTPESLAGTVVVLNVFASWCEGCVIEHPVLMKLAKTKQVEIVGLAWRDQPERIKAWLAEHGNPYDRVAVDEQGMSTLPLALSGVPETFVFDKSGRVAYHARMPVTEEEMNNTMLPLIEKLHAR